MKRMLFNATYQEELRVAAVEGKKLINFDIETTSKTQRRGNIYKGIITRVEASLEACFVDYGTDKQGFLPFKEIDPAYLTGNNGRERNFNRLNEGDELIVQVEKDERGNKGAALTTYVSLPGRYLVLMPNNSRSGGISRRIDGDERDELKNVLSTLTVPRGMSVIARTAALGRFAEELQWDLNYLIKLWEAVRSASFNHEGSFLIYQESNLVVRSIRDHFSPDINEILIDTEEVYEQAKQFMSHVMPNFVERVKFYNDDVPLFSRFQIEHQIETAYGRMVNLPSGGAIAIDHTEALTAIDVNSAKANKGSDIEATALATNMEAAEEIARQLRLRDLGGLVVVDFIDMESQKNQREVENHLKQQLGMDRARIQMSKLSKFGLLELSRQRLQSSLGESTTIACPRCNGVGTIRGTESNAVHILRIIQEEAVRNSSYVSQLHIQLPVPVATYLLNEKREDITKIETRMKMRIVLIPNLHLDSPNYKIRKISNDSHDSLANRLSFNLVENFDENQTYQINENKSDSSLQNNAVVKNITPSQPAPMMKSFSLKKIFGKVVDLLKGFNLRDEKDELPVKTIVDKVASSSNKHTPNTRSNTKARPVGINRNNNKIQTVKQNTANNDKRDNAFVGKSVVKDPTLDKERIKPSNELAAKTSNKAESNNTASQVNVPQHSARHNPQNKAAINQAWQKPQPQTQAPSQPEVRVTNVDAVAVKPEIKNLLNSESKGDLEAQTSSLSAPVVKDNAIVKEMPVVKPVVEEKKRINTIVEPVDLGSFELVATTNKPLNQPEITPDRSLVKRYNDVVVEKVAVVESINYELIETVKSSS